MRIEISNYQRDVYLNAGVNYSSDRVLTVALDELPDEELVTLLMKLAEKKVRAMLAEMRAPKPVVVDVADEPSVPAAAGAA